MRYKLFTCLMAIVTFDVMSGVKPVHTREVIGLDNEYKVDIVNTSDNKYLVQAWLEDLNGSKKNIPVVLTPPIFEIENYGTGLIRLLPITNSLPKDRESVFWLNTQEIPQKSKDQGVNRLQMAVRTRIKIFLRPKQLSIQGLKEASSNLVWSKHDTYITATNDSPYYLSMGELMIETNNNSERLPDRFDMVPPFSTQNYDLPELYQNKPITIKHGVINDFGGINVIHETKFN
ncbi:fimbrial biogenesis chaperone [Vibrio owensii]|uniref:fimbrial biogenesis chaperone n=1 Tax=Vibrio owensii TaxID=696485 RepID=UPI0003A2DD6C|nr:molecular chaperone [Vibrio owensii]